MDCNYKDMKPYLIVSKKGTQTFHWDQYDCNYKCTSKHFIVPKNALKYLAVSNLIVPEIVRTTI